MKSTSGDSGAMPSRADAWRVISSDGECNAAEAREHTTADNRGNLAARTTPRADHGGEEIETLADFLQDEDLTLLDLDLLNCDMSLLTSQTAPVAEPAQSPPSAISLDESLGRVDRDLAHVIEAWPYLSADLKRAIGWIAAGGTRSSRDVC